MGIGQPEHTGGALSATTMTRTHVRYSGSTVWHTAAMRLAGGVDWGNVPTWLAALFTSASVGFLAAAYLRDRRETAEAQARRVIVWVERLSDTASLSPSFKIFVRNTSDQPIREVWFEIRGRSPEACEKALRGLAPAQAQAIHQRMTPDNPVASQLLMIWDSVETKEVLPGSRSSAALSLDHTPLFYDYYLTFMDAVGRKWRRDLQYDSLTRTEAKVRQRVQALLGNRRQLLGT